MDSGFWLRKWEKQETGFHLERVNPQLERYHSKLFRQKTPVFVPLCGKSLDMHFLAQQGYPVIGVELSPIAVRAFFEENQLEYQLSTTTSFEIFQSGLITVLCGDFFALEPARLSGCQQIYDRAALIALSAEQRRRYVEKLKQLLPDRSTTLLITLAYNRQEMSGPPFSVNRDEVSALFPFAEIEQLYQRDIIEHEHRFRARGVTRLDECVYALSW